MSDAYDVPPESEEYQEGDDLENALYVQEQARRMQEQAELRALCIENGEDAEKFLTSNFGQYILGQAELEVEQAKEVLTNVDPDDKTTINKLQNRIKQMRSFESWIKNAIDKGDAEYLEYIQAQ